MGQTWKEKSGDLLFSTIDDTAFFLWIDETRSPVAQQPVRVTKTNFITGLNSSLSFVSSSSFASSFTLVTNGVDLDPDFGNKYNGFLIYVATEDINLSTPANAPDGAIATLVVLASGGDRTVSFVNNSRLTKEGGNGTGSIVVTANEELTLRGVVNGGIIYWSILDGDSAAVNVTVANLTFNPASDQTYASSATHQTYTQTDAFNFDTDLTGAINGVTKTYQIVGNGANIVFDSNCVNSDDGITAVGTINKTGTFAITTWYDASISKIRVDIPIFDAEDPKLSSQDITWAATNTHNVNNGYDAAVFGGTEQNCVHNITNASLTGIHKGLISYDLTTGGSEVTFQKDGVAADCEVVGSANSVATLGTGDYTLFAWAMKKINATKTIIVITQTDK